MVKSRHRVLVDIITHEMVHVVRRLACANSGRAMYNDAFKNLNHLVYGHTEYTDGSETVQCSAGASRESTVDAESDSESLPVLQDTSDYIWETENSAWV